MNKKLKKILGILCLVTLIVGMMTSCNKTVTEPNDTTNSESLFGTITMAGSTSMEKLANGLAEDFMSKNKRVTVNAEFIGSGAGIEAVNNGTVDIGNSSRNLKDSEEEAGAVENIVAIDGIAIILEKSNLITNLSKDELIAIYTGSINNWSELGGDDMPIVVIGREAGSGTRGAFEEILKVEEQCRYSNELDNTGAVMAKVATTKGAIGYVSHDVVDDTVISASLDGIESTVDNIKSRAYFLSRPFVMETKGEIAEQSELVQAFFEYIYSEEGKAIITSVGLINVD